MCVLHINIESDNIDNYLASTNLPIYQVFKKGDHHKYAKNKMYEDNLISCVVSDSDWDNLEDQTNDMINFLENYHLDLQILKDNFKIKSWEFDIPHTCRISNKIYMQSSFLPPKLISLAGRFGIGIELSMYTPAQEDKKVKKRKTNK
jgi:hypothetical protein